ncbi:MAG TPA: hypothetical protein VFM11_06780 [Burkholderiales bacterium]|nr:hypothetical protein [Burkholderiales bacterium]
MNRQGARDAKEKQIKKANGKRKDAKAAKERKEKPKQKFFAAFLCAFAPLRLLLFSAFPLRLCASAVIDFQVFLASLASWRFNNQP